MRTAALALTFAILSIFPRAADAAATADRTAVLTLDNALDGKQALQVHLLLNGRDAVAAFGQGWNARPHAVRYEDLTGPAEQARGQWRMTLDVTVRPDNWIPAGGKPVPCHYSLYLQEADGELSGTYAGYCGTQACGGNVTGVLGQPLPADAYRRLRIRIPGAIRRIYNRRRSSWKYALDMDLSLTCRDGRITHPRLETLVPDYRRYSAEVKDTRLSIDGPRLRGQVDALIDNGRQSTGKDDPRVELHTFDLDLVMIGDTPAGRCDIKVGEIEATEWVKGEIDRTSPPDPGRSIARLRLHKAMQDDGPVILTLSLHRDGLIHGLAYAPAENHQPHTVDASGLTLQGDRLGGDLRITVVPDVYRGGEPFDIRYRLDAQVEGANVLGSFSGNDRGLAREGLVTGELSPKAATQPVQSVADLGRCELDLGYSLVGGPKPHQGRAKRGRNNASVVLRFKDGKPVDSKVVQPDGTALDATVQTADLNIDGDRLTGEVAFDLRSETHKQGRYRFEFEAIIRGARFGGFWRGWAEGKPILTKSSKLHGTLQPADTTP